MTARINVFTGAFQIRDRMDTSCMIECANCMAEKTKITHWDTQMLSVTDLEMRPVFKFLFGILDLFVMIICLWERGMGNKGDLSRETAKKEKRLRASALRKIKAAKDTPKKLKTIRALFAVKDPWASDILLEALKDPNEEIRELIIRELGSRKDLDVELISQKLSHPYWYVKSSALKILGLTKNDTALLHIEAILADPNVEVRRAITACLGDIGGKRALSLLMILAKDTNRFVRSSAEDAIRKISNLRFT
jgi:hypothetical protein